MGLIRDSHLPFSDASYPDQMRCVKQFLFVLDVISFAFCIAFSVCTWLSPLGVLLTKPVPVLLAGAGGCLLLYLYAMCAEDVLGGFVTFCTTAMPACAFTLFAAGDCATEIGDYSTVESWLTVGGVLFAAGQLLFATYAICHAACVKTAAICVWPQRRGACISAAVLALVLVACQLGVLAFAWFALTAMSTLARIYLIAQVVEGIAFAVSLCGSGSVCLVLLFNGGVLLFSISDALMFAVDYGYTQMSPELGSVIAMWLYWGSCAATVIGCRAVALDHINPSPPTIPN